MDAPVSVGRYPMIPKPFDAISKDDIDALVANAVYETRTIEYKVTLPGGSDEEKREFLADISSFANAAGGDIIYGIEEEKGVPVSVNGLGAIDTDAEILRLDSMIRNGIEPRVPGVQIRGIGNFAAGPAIVVRVPRSWMSPHMVTFKNLSKFYSRTNAGKFQLDVGQVRSAFLLAESISDRIRAFRDDRLSKIVAGETPLPMGSGAKMILHMLPVSSFSTPATVDVVAVANDFARLPTMSTLGRDARLNLDGCVTYDSTQDGLCYSYTLLFRSGAVEAADTQCLSSKRIDSVTYEEGAIRVTRAYLPLLTQLGVGPPIVIMFAMVGVKGFEFDVGDRLARRARAVPMDRDVLILPDVLVEDIEQHPASILKPIFDMVWQSAGFPHSLNYREDGRWAPDH
jgi:hypothetical protein